MSVRDSAAEGHIFRDHLTLLRFTYIPTAVSNVLAGTVLAASLHYSRDLLLVMLAMVLFSTAGMYLGDILDTNHSLASGLARGITIALLAIGLALLAIVGWPPFIAGMVLVAVIAVYAAWHTSNAPRAILMALTRLMVYIVAFFAFTSEVTWELAIWCVVMLVYVTGLPYISRTESLPGAGRYWPLAMVLLPALVAVIMQPGEVLVWSLAVALVLWVAHSVSFAWRTSNRQVGGAIARLIAGISLLDALVLATHEAWWGVIIAMSCLAATMSLQRFVRGT